MKYSHTIDHQSGRRVRHELASVTVFDSRGCEWADAWATALMALGSKKGLEVAEKEGLQAYFILTKPKEEKFDIRMTNNFKSLIEKGGR